ARPESRAGGRRRLAGPGRPRPAPPGPRAGRGRPAPTPATGRDQEVASLVVSGLTDKQIGDRLFISPKTIEHHVVRLRRVVSGFRRPPRGEPPGGGPGHPPRRPRDPALGVAPFGLGRVSGAGGSAVGAGFRGRPPAGRVGGAARVGGLGGVPAPRAPRAAGR